MNLDASIGSWVFYVDEGAVYDVWFTAEGEGYVVGRRSKVTYRSVDHAIRLTGKRRVQTTGRGLRVDGYRAILTLDTGEGLSDLRGVAA